MVQKYEGSCHCGRVTFELQAGTIREVTDCNCSICRRRGALWHGTTGDNFRILSGESELSLYQFGTNTAKHYFCRHCGVHPYGHPRLDPALVVVNVRCIDSIDLSSLKVGIFDGVHWEEAARALRESLGLISSPHSSSQEIGA